jgi:hypothetical protein
MQFNNCYFDEVLDLLEGLDLSLFDSHKLSSFVDS